MFSTIMKISKEALSAGKENCARNFTRNIFISLTQLDVKHVHMTNHEHAIDQTY